MPEIVRTTPDRIAAAAPARRVATERLIARADAIDRAPWAEERRARGLSLFARAGGGATLAIRYRWRESLPRTSVSLGLSQTAGPRIEAGESAERLDARLAAWQALIWPEIAIGAAPAMEPLPFRHALAPRAGEDGPVRAIPRTEADRRLDPWADMAPAPADGDLGSALTLLSRLGAAELLISLTGHRLSAPERRRLGLHWRDGKARRLSQPWLFDRATPEERLLQSGIGLRVAFEAAFASEPDASVLEMLSQALFGCGHEPAETSNGRFDPRRLRPLDSGLPDLLVKPPAPPDPAPPSVVAEGSAGAATLGRCPDTGEAITLPPRDRGRHLYVIGATGTGKSTLLLNILKQDMDAGEGVILIDPHGDLADEARRLVPPHRSGALRWCDFTDAATAPSINILAIPGRDPEAERSIVANQLVDLFQSIIYRGVPDAFGPMFQQYFRNGVLLLMAGGGEKARLTDFERIFYDATFRNQLLKNCGDAKIREFWNEIVENVSSDAEHNLANMAPYVTSKLAQITSNPVVRRFVSGKAELDLESIMNRGDILILKLSKGFLGSFDARLISTIIVLRILQAGLARAQTPPTERRTCRLVFDEFQNCHGQPLADLLAEGRKYGIALTLANQSLGQVTGRAGNDDAGDAALANAASLVAFRVGANDAAQLAPWLQPDIRPTALMRLPDFTAVARVLQNGRPRDPLPIATAPPPPAES